MPLYGQDGKGSVNQPFDYVIACTADGNQPFSCAVYGLMMGGVYSGAVSVELVKEIAAAQIAVENRVELVAADPFMRIGGVDVLCDVAAEMNIDELKPFADAEHGLFLFHEAGEKLKLQNVELRVHISGTVIFLTEKGGGDVAAAGKEQMGGMIRGLRQQEGMVGDAHSFQYFLVVLRIFIVAGDDNRGERRHRADSFLVALFYHMQGEKIGLNNFLE